MQEIISRKINFIGLNLLLILMVCLFMYGCSGSHKNEYGRFVKAGNMHINRPGISNSIKLQNGSVLIWGGEQFTSINDPARHTTQSEIFNPMTKKFTLGPKFPRNATIVSLSNGKLLVDVSTRNAQGFLYCSTFLYDLSSNQKFIAPEMNYLDTARQPVILPNGKIFFAGGPRMHKVKDITNTNEPFYTELYDPTKNIFERGPRWITPRYIQKYNIIPLNDGTVLFAFGYMNGAMVDSPFEIYDPTKNTMSPINVPSDFDKECFWSGIVLKNNKILFIGAHAGEGMVGKQYTKALLFDVKDKSVSIIGTVNREYLWNGQMTVLKDGNVLLTGFQKADAFLIAYGAKLQTYSYIFDYRKKCFVEGPSRVYVGGSQGVILDNSNVLIPNASSPKKYEDSKYAEVFISKKVSSNK